MLGILPGRPTHMLILRVLGECHQVQLDYHQVQQQQQLLHKVSQDCNQKWIRVNSTSHRAPVLLGCLAMRRMIWMKENLVRSQALSGHWMMSAVQILQM